MPLRRNLCPSCQAKRAALFADKLVDEILDKVPHRHSVFTIPKALRGLFERDRRLLGLLSRTGYDAILRSFRAVFGRNPCAVRRRACSGAAPRDR